MYLLCSIVDRIGRGMNIPWNCSKKKQKKKKNIGVRPLRGFKFRFRRTFQKSKFCDVTQGKI